MKFLIYKASWVSYSTYKDLTEKHKPCDYATLESATRTTMVKTRDRWPDTGKPVYVDKEITEYYWTVNIDSLEDLLKLLKDVNYNLIIDASVNDDNFELPFAIIVYDDYIE